MNVTLPHGWKRPSCGYVILECLIGSSLHGTAVDDATDYDLMGVTIEPAHALFRFAPEDTWVARTQPDGVRSGPGDVDYVAYGLRKFLRLALSGNPTILLALFAPERACTVLTQTGMDLQRLAPLIVSRAAFRPFLHYVQQQHERLIGLRGQKNVTRPELVEAFGYDTKYAAHIVRLGYQGEELLLSGRIVLPMPAAQRDHVVAVRTGKVPLVAVSAEIEASKRRLREALDRSPLSEKPDHVSIERWMINQYIAAGRNFWDGSP